MLNLFKSFAVIRNSNSEGKSVANGGVHGGGIVEGKNAPPCNIARVYTHLSRLEFLTGSIFSTSPRVKDTHTNVILT